MRIIHNILGFVLATALLTSCVRENETVEPYEAPKGGKGGNATIKVTAQHHEKTISNAKIYVKYADKNYDYLPWDDSFVTGGTAVLDSMKAGDYYFYAEGDDDALAPGDTRINGGASFKVIDTLKKEYNIFIQMDDWRHHIDKDQ